jgi:hypothetical protein
MKSRVIDSLSAVRRRLSGASSSQSFRVFRITPRVGLGLLGAASVLTLSGCYYPYGYYPSYAAVPSAATQREVQVDQNGTPVAQSQQPLTPDQQAQAEAQYRQAQQAQASGYAGTAAPAPVYVAPAYAAYPAYYPYPAYPAYYGYPGWWGGPSVSVGFGFWGGHGGYGGHGYHR